MAGSAPLVEEVDAESLLGFSQVVVQKAEMRCMVVSLCVEQGCPGHEDDYEISNIGGWRAQKKMRPFLYGFSRLRLPSRSYSDPKAREAQVGAVLVAQEAIANEVAQLEPARIARDRREHNSSPRRHRTAC